jgi:integrase/recombinase XerD
MEATYSISTFIKSKNAGGNNALIYVRITINRERAELSIKRSIDRTRWGADANRLGGNKEDAKEINTLLDNTILKVNKIYSKLLENGELISARRIKDIYVGSDKRKKSLLQAFTDHNQMMARG